MLLIGTQLIASPCLALNFKNGYSLIQTGFSTSNQSYIQDIHIKELIGDRFTVSDNKSFTGLFGLGFLFKGYSQEKWGIDYGLNAFYLLNTVSGTIKQEQIFTNLAYSYKVKHAPLYALVKLYVSTPLDKIALTIDAGLGPNFMKTDNYKDWPLDPIICPDNAFSGRTKTVLSAMAGFGLRLPPLSKLSSIELGYRYFYLGQGDFNARTNQILNTLNTGTNTAHALILTASI